MHGATYEQLLLRVERELERALRLISEPGDARPVLLALEAVARMLADEDEPPVPGRGGTPIGGAQP